MDITLKPQMLTTVNYSLQQNRLPVIRCVEIDNKGEETSDVIMKITSSPSVFEDISIPVDIIPGGKVYEINDIKVILDADKLANITEKLTVNVRFELAKGEEVISRTTEELSVLAFDQWIGIKTYPELLTAFITPNHPRLSAIISRASDFLSQWTGSSAFDEYQSEDTDRCIKQAAAIFAAIQEQNIIYVSVPPTYDAGQRIRLCDMVLDQKQANCLDISLLYTACLESVGLNPILVLIEGHIFAGLWLEDRKLSEPTTDDPAVVSKRLADGVNEMIVVECTMMCSGEVKKDFDNARKAAEKSLLTKRVESIIDIKRARLSGITPLPIRVMTDQGYVIERDMLDADKITSAPSSMGKKVEVNIDAAGEGSFSRKMRWERKLLDLGLRNTLIDMRISKSTIPFLLPSIDRFEDMLNEGKDFKILGKPSEIEFPTGKVDFEALAAIDPIKPLLESEIDNGRIRAAATDGELQTKMKELYRSAKVSLEENGANTLYVALGLLKWYETDVTTRARYAPLVLVPVDVVRRSITEGYIVRLRDDDPQMNITILEKLKQDFGIVIGGLDPLPTDEKGIDIRTVMSIIRQAVMGQKRWDVLETASIGIFSFSQFVMWNDIRNRSEELEKNKIVKSLVEGHLTWDAEEMEIGDTVDEEGALVPLSADSSQLFAIKSAAEGKSFVLHGPPGTGKSQTITSMIANSLAEGKSVLFVAEKMAALEVVYNRLSKIGLQPFCLELHSNKAKKRSVLDQLKMATEVTKTESPEEFRIKAEQIRKVREDLNSYAKALHLRRDCGMSVYELIEMFEDNIDAPDIGIADDGLLDSLDRQKISDSIVLADRLSSSMKLAGTIKDNPLSDVSEKTYSQKIKGYLDSYIDEYSSSLEGIKNVISAINGTEPGAVTFNDLDVIDKKIKDDSVYGITAQKIKDQLTPRWKDSFLELDTSDMASEFKKAEVKWFLPKLLGQNAVTKILKQHSKASVNKMTLLDDLKLQDEYRVNIVKAREIEAANGDKYVSFNDSVKKYNDSRVKLDEILHLYDPDPSSTIDERIISCGKIVANKEKLREWTAFNSILAECEEQGYKKLVSAVKNGLEPDQTTPALQKHLASSLAMRYIDADPALASFSGVLFDEKVKQFKKLDNDLMELTRKEIYCRLASNIPDFKKQGAGSSELGILQKAIKSGGRGLSIRNLIKQLPNLLPRLSPCMLMSPLSAAQYLDPEREMFDFVIFDEASQIPTCKAVGALARGKNAVIVGDPNQMPPTTFFMAEQTDEEHLDEEDLESILDDCLALGIPQTHLLWHYRSRHESLIAFSNSKFYENRLFTFPSVNDRQSKVTMVHVEGVFNRGKGRTNKAEAEAVIEELKKRCHDPELSALSVGIVTFNINQQNLIDDMLSDACREDRELEAWAFSSAEPLFIKNLENVQGDERDVILFSVGYGPDESGNIYMNFGPLNRDGGWRRLNVAVSRARCEMKVFSTLTPDKIDLSRTSAEGVAALKAFLEYAEGRDLTVTSNTVLTSRDDRSAIADEIVRRLKDQGYDAVRSVGRSEYKIDVGVIDPESEDSYKLGIMLDGHTYAAARTARDRELSQSSVLEGLGWKLMRIWTMDWWENPDKEMQKIIDVLTAPDDPDPTDPNAPTDPGPDGPASDETDTSGTSDPEQSEPVNDTAGEDNSSPAFTSDLIKYESAQLSPRNISAAELPSRRMELEEMIGLVIEKEAPVSKTLLIKRITTSCGIARSTSRINEVVRSIILANRIKTTIQDEETFYWNCEPSEYSIFRYTDNMQRDITDIPNEEIKNAMIRVINDQISLSHQDLIKECARILGFPRLGSKITMVMESAIRYCASNGVIHKGANGNWITY